jgi:hypothetical protein
VIGDWCPQPPQSIVIVMIIEVILEDDFKLSVLANDM